MRIIHRCSCPIVILIFLASVFDLCAQSTSHPHLYFDQAGMDALRNRALTNSRLNKMWLKFKKDRVENKAMKIVVAPGPLLDLEEGRNYGDALADLTIAYIVTRDQKYVDKAKEIALDLAEKSDWGEQLIVAHISIGLAFCWDVMYDKFTASEQKTIKDAARANSNNHINPNPLSNHNWTPAAGEGLIGLAFGFSDLLNDAKLNFKEGAGSVLWAHGSDGFSPQGPGYWRKYDHVGLFFHALRFNEPQNDWFHLGKEYPGSEFLRQSSYPRIYGHVQHADMSCITWCDALQVGNEAQGPYGNMGMITLDASEYNDGYVLSFLDHLLNEAGYRFEDEDSAAFIFFDDQGVPSKSFRDLPLSGYWPNMEGAIFRSSWEKDALVFYMRCGSPGGHARRIKGLVSDQHSHPDANGFLLFYNNDYLAAEDGARPEIGPHIGKAITYGHNTILIDGAGQRGDLSTRIEASDANMDFLDADHVGYLLGDATDAYKNLDRFYRYVIYKKHKYAIVVDELKDDLNHKYEFVLGTDKRHTITSGTGSKFTVKAGTGAAAKLPLVFVEPQSLQSSIQAERPYIFSTVLVEMLRVWPSTNARNATFFALLYPRKSNESDPAYTKIYDGGRSGILVDGDEYHLYNDSGVRYTYRTVTTDAKLCYFKDNPGAFEYLTAGSTEFLYSGQTGITSSKTLVAAFKGVLGKIRLGKNLGTSGEATITLYYPRITGVLVDGQTKSLVGSGSGNVTFKLSPKDFKIGPSGYEQTVTDNYDVEILTGGSTPFVQVARPNGGESWAAGSSQSIEWTSSGSFANVKIEYSTDSGTSWQVITNSTTNDGQFSWTVPSTPSSNALVRVSDAADGSPSDVSENVFSITGGGSPSAPVISSFTPTSGSVGTTVTITGSNFTATTAVTFNGIPASFVFKSDNELQATVPTGAATGKVKVTNSAGTGTSASDFVVASGGGGTQTFTPTDDAFVWSSKSTSNYGSSTNLRVRKTSADQIAYFKFNVTGLTGSVVSAKLRLLCTDASNNGGSIYLVSNNFLSNSNPWTEGGLIWTNAPSVSGSALSSVGAVVVGQTVEWDVSAAITGNGIYSFTIKNGSSDAAYYSSKEGTQVPQLEIQTSASSTAAKLGEKEGSDLVQTLPLPERLTLDPNYPNPFNLETTIQYGLPEATEILLVIYNLRGQEVRTLVNEYQSPGYKTVRWDGRDNFGQEVSSGVYFTRLRTGQSVLTRKLTLQK